MWYSECDVSPAVYDRLSASTGFILEALQAGIRPPKMPTATARSTAKATTSGLMAGAMFRVVEEAAEAAETEETARDPADAARKANPPPANPPPAPVPSARDDLLNREITT